MANGSNGWFGAVQRLTLSLGVQQSGTFFCCCLASAPGAKCAPLGYLVRVRHAALAGSPAKAGHFYVVADYERQTFPLVKASLQLGDQTMEIVRTLTRAECEALGLKLYQVKRASQLP